MKTDFSIGSVRVRLELVPIVAVLALVANFELALAVLAAVLIHEAAHFYAARALGTPGTPLTLQVTGGGSYVRTIESPGRKIAVLAAGPAASLAVSTIALVIRVYASGSLALFAGGLFWASTVWAIYQMTPFPPLDGGQVLRILLAPRFTTATTAWRIGWVLGFAAAIGWVLADFRNAEPVILLTGMALILGRGEAGYVRHLDAYAAWEKGDHAKVIELVKRVPEYLDKQDRAMLLELGIFSAMEIKNVEALEEIARSLPAHRPVVMKAAEWLLLHDRAYGAKLAQHAIDALDQELVKPDGEHKERFADLAFRYAVFESKELRLESALGLLERAIDLGFSDADRVRADGDLRPIAQHPRFLAILSRIETRA